MQRKLELLHQLREAGEMKATVEKLEVEADILQEESNVLMMIVLSLSLSGEGESKEDAFELLDYCESRLKEIKSRLLSMTKEKEGLAEKVEKLISDNKDMESLNDLLKGNNICKN